ncbi:MAG: phospholipase D-like domain-containing protein [Candidatus Tritonobacter lacicola]|nr:phospholipase D-like domain-containing protein [Candidatus Tritonobacter lacicola]
MGTRSMSFPAIFCASLLVLVFGGCGEKKPEGPAVLSYKEAGKHIGEVSTVEGTIVSTYSGKNSLKLNFDTNYRRYLSITIPLKYLEQFPENPQSYYKGKKIRATGRITRYSGAPSMLVTDGPQIRLAKPAEGEPPPPAVVQPVFNREYLPKAIEIIDGAGDSLRIIMYLYKYSGHVKKIYRALKKAEERGVDVKIIMDDEIASNRESAPYLEQAGVDVKIDGPEKKTHCKIIIADSDKVLMGSTNFSNSSLGRNNETNVFIESRAVAGYYEDYFNKLWKDPSREHLLSSKPAVEGIIPLVNREYLWSLLPRLNGAKKRIWVVMYGTKLFEEPDNPVHMVLSSLVRATKRDVDVRVVLDMGPDEEWCRITNELNREVAGYLSKRGVPVKFESPDVITHAKLIIIDDEAFVGSTNWGYGGFKRYNSTNAIISDRKAVGAYEKYFLNLWEGEPYGIEQVEIEEKAAA